GGTSLLPVTRPAARVAGDVGDEERREHRPPGWVEPALGHGGPDAGIHRNAGVGRKGSERVVGRRRSARGLHLHLADAERQGPLVAVPGLDRVAWARDRRAEGAQDLALAEDG